MGKYLPPVTLDNFVLGLNEKVGSNLIDQRELVESLNMFVGPGYCEKRYGYTAFRTDQTSFLYEFFKSNGTSEFLAVKPSNNLLPSFNFWTKHANAVVNERYDLTLTASGAFQSSYVFVDVLEGETYYIKGTIPTNGIIEVQRADNGVILKQLVTGMSAGGTFTVPTGVRRIKVLVLNNSTTTGTYNFTNLMLNSGLTSIPFEDKLITLYKDNGTSLVAATMTNELETSKIKMLTYNDRTMNDVVLIADGGKLKTYNGTVVSEVSPRVPTTPEQTDPGLNDLANLTAVRSIVINKERIYIVGHPTNKNRVSFCHIDPSLGYGVYDYFPATHFFDLAVDDNDEIIELKAFRGAVIVFCRRSVWAIYGSGRTADDYQIIKINVPTGCIAPNSIINVGNAIFYLSDTHIYALTSTDQDYISAEIVSDRIENTLKGFKLTDKEQAVGTFFKDKYYLSFPDGKTVVFDNLLGNWTLFTNIKAKSFLNRSGVLYFAGDKLFKFDETIFNDDGEPITARIKLKNMDFGFPVQDKKFRRMWVVARQYIAESSTYSISAKIDDVPITIESIETDQSLVWNEGKWGKTYWGFKDVVRNELDIRKRGTNFQLIIENNTINQPFTFYSVSFEFAVKRP